MNKTSKNEYRTKLRRIIKSSSSGMLLNADVFYDSSGRETLTTGAAFETTSGSFQKYFITLWELFDQRKHFSECMQMFASEAQQIRREKPFSSIVTCTETAKHIMDHVHAAIETDHEKVNVHYLGHYPFLNIDNRGFLDFKNERVLIITDVVATGTLVRNIAEIVEEVGAIPVAILCVALTGEDLIAEQKATKKPPNIEFGKQKTKIRVHSLTDFAIKRLQPEEFDKQKVRKINPVTVLPEESLHHLNGFKPLFDNREMFKHFEESCAIGFGFFEMDTRRFTTTIRFDRVLEKYGDQIWQSVRERITPKAVIVTTFNREDIRFKEFIEDRYQGKLTCIFVPRRDSLEAASSYFLLSHSVKKIENRPVILLLSSVHTSEKLRNLASLLASHSVKRISVICLLNRMGFQTMDFISRIRNLLRGVGGGNRNSATGFEFNAIYSMSDLNSDDIIKTQQMLSTLFSHYLSETRVPSFRRWMSQDQKYFKANSLTARDFEQALPTPLPSEFCLDNSSISVNTQESKLFLLCSHLVTKRDYTPLIEEMTFFSEKETLYRIFAILLLDLNYLRMTGQFKKLRSNLIERIRDLREIRFSLDGHDEDHHIEKYVETETYLLFGIALFSFLDPEFDYNEFIIETLTCGKRPEEWVDFRDNLSQYFGEERVLWSISLLMIFSNHRFRQPDVASGLKDTVKKIVGDYIKLFENALPDEGTFDQERKHRIKANLNLLLTELGAHEHRRKYQIIRYLHSLIINLPKGHNPINSSLENATDTLKAVVDFGKPVEQREGNDGNPNSRIRIDERDTKKELEDAIYTTGILEQLSIAIRQMFFFTQASKSQIERFASGPDDPGFAADVIALGDLLQNIRIVNSVSKREMEKITELQVAIFHDLWEESSPLRKALLRYIVHFQTAIEEAMESANKMLQKLHFDDVWRGELEKVRNSKHIYYVLVDPFLLGEVLKNIFSNVRHNFEEYILTSKEKYSDLVVAKIEKLKPDEVITSLDSEDVEYIQLTVLSGGNPFRSQKDGTTISQHKLEIERFGGSLEVDPLNEQSGTVVKLRLLARQLPKRGMVQ
jgi:orotate phosphoribosyltransferase